jgi:hypothetical protein
MIEVGRLTLGMRIVELCSEGLSGIEVAKYRIRVVRAVYAVE